MLTIRRVSSARKSLTISWRYLWFPFGASKATKTSLRTMKCAQGGGGQPVHGTVERGGWWKTAAVRGDKTSLRRATVQAGVHGGGAGRRNRTAGRSFACTEVRRVTDKGGVAELHE